MGLMSLLIVLSLGILMHMLSSFRVDGTDPSGATAVALGYLLLSAFFVGRLFHQLRLPRLTGYIVMGVAVGPSALRLLTEDSVTDLKFVNGLAVVLIALTAGTELELRALRPLLRSIAWITLLGVVASAALLAACTYAMSPWLPFLQDLEPAARASICVVLGVVMAAQSPAVVVALNDESRASGPLTRTVLGVVVLADLVVVLLFAFSSSVAKATFGGAASPLATAKLLAWELFGSLGIGALLGLILALFLRRVGRGTALFILNLAFLIAEVGLRVHLDPLLVALAAGIVVRNATRSGDHLQREIARFALPVYILFFAVAGANLHLGILKQLGPPAALLVLVRAATMFYGARLGAGIAGADPSVRKYAGYGLLPQAGLALALSMIFARAFPELGETAGAMILGVVALNELVAPIGYRMALHRSGEAGKRVAEGDAPASSASTAAPNALVTTP